MKALSISNWRVQFAFGVTILALLIVGAISYRELTSSIESNRWSRHTHEVLESIHDLSLDWASISSDSRGFVLTGENSYFESYRAEAVKAQEDAEVIRRLTVDNPKQQARISILKPQITDRIEQVEQITSLRRTQGLTAAVAEMQRIPDEQQTAQFNVVTQELQSEEFRLLALRDATTKLRLNSMKAGLISGALLIFLIAMALGWGAMRESSALGLAEMSLRESDEKYRILVDGVVDYAIFMLDPDGTIISWNAGAERIEGYRAEQIIGCNFSCFFPPEDIERGSPEDILRLAVANGRYEESGVRVRKDGLRFSAMVTVTALRDVAGNLRGFSEITRDLSEHKQSEEKYRSLLEAAPDAMVVVDRNEKISLLNVQAENEFGYRRDELVGQSVTRIIPEGFAERLIADGTRTEAEASSQRIGMGIELTARRKDESEFPIEIMLSPLETADGIQVTAAIRDISQRKESEAKYRGLLEAAPDAMVVVDQQGEIVLLNLQAERQFGYRRDELLGQKVTSIIPEGFAERLIADETRTAAEALAQQIGTGIELYGLRKDHTEFPMEIMLSPLETIGGILVTAAIRDISVRKKAEADLLKNVKELHRSNEELEQFAYIASHDLQEPLRMVASYTQLIGRRYKGKLDSDADEFIAFAVDGASRMQRLIMDLLTYSRVGTKETVLRDISGDEALRQALFNLRGAIEESGAQVTCDPLPMVSADETQLVQLFQNLIGNAIKYQNRGSPTVHVSAARDGIAKWNFSVKDNGLGIEPQYFERVFGMFQRLHKREEFTGTGMGLAICKKIVERHGGSISVESQLGQGSTFCFVLRESENKL
jgi:PAS domain S-box-containing protein